MDGHYPQSAHFSTFLPLAGQALRIQSPAMSTFSAYATNFECCDLDNPAGKHLLPLFSRMERVDFQFHVADPSMNQGQMGSTEGLGRVLLVGYAQYDWETDEKLSPATRQRMRKLAAEARPATKVASKPGDLRK